MKKTLSIMMVAVLTAAAGVQTVNAQKMLVKLADNKIVRYDVSQVQYVAFLETAFVDLGLPSGTFWATCNIGASEPEEVGGYYAWGEKDTKDTYSWTTYQLCDGSNQTMNKYCTNEYYGTVDGRKALEPADDVVATLFGDGWSMPTKEQFEELLDGENTTWNRTTQKGVEGLKVTSKMNGKSIFLPIGGFRDMTSSYSTSNGYYWTKDLYAGIDNLACSLSIESNSVSSGDSKSRRCGLNIRPVYKETSKHEYVDLGLPSGTLWATCNVGANSPKESGDLFAWGETTPKDSYSWDNYKYCNGTSNTLTKYCSNAEYGYNGFTDTLTELLPEDDAATANWGSEWQTPSWDQILELLSEYNTTWSWDNVDGVKGLTITSLINKNSIFIPLDNGMGLYWLRSFYSKEDSYADLFVIVLDDYFDMGQYPRFNGTHIRPVRKK